jgi:4-hydroxybenzoyl-CoA thioesterase
VVISAGDARGKVGWNGGVMLNGKHQVRVYWGHCDPAKIVFYPNYYVWIDQSSHEMLEKGGLDQLGLRRRYGLRGTVLGSVVAEFKAPSYFGDVLDVFSQVGKIGRSTFEIDHRILRDETLIATARELRIWVVDDESSPSGIKAVPIPDAVQDVLAGRAAAY